jgi:hypothetical protein
MGSSISGHFSRSASAPESLQAKLNRAMRQFEQHKTLFAAQKLRETIFPDSELFGHYLAVDGRWVAELRYDHLIHEAEGPTLADAIASAVRQIVDGLENE